jgi:hypothetical protein
MQTKVYIRNVYENSCRNSSVYIKCDLLKVRYERRDIFITKSFDLWITYNCDTSELQLGCIEFVCTEISDFDIKFRIKSRTTITFVEDNITVAEIVLQRNISTCMQIAQREHTNVWTELKSSTYRINW